MNFNSYKILREFGSVLDWVLYLNWICCIDNVLEYGVDLLRRVRRDILKVVIFIILGVRDFFNLFDVVSNFLKVLGVKLFIVVIGNVFDIRELCLVVVNNDDIFRVLLFCFFLGIEEFFLKYIIFLFCK